jgi:hypothetical protein
MTLFEKMGLANIFYTARPISKNYQPKATGSNAFCHDVKDQEDAKGTNSSNSRNAEKESDSNKLRPLTVQLSNNEY